ncbi:MAG: DNA mismatch repair endonuclease MutL [Spirochaetaceae bacterium]|nr:DNA mismatch repair endonuclease MutL [Spirochaetaceae bacterium]
MENNGKKQIQLLVPEEARKIAAGEVVERPASLIREFLDNAIDAGAEHIDVAIQDGGCRLIEVVDDGCGMEYADLALCYQDHATSKIRCLDDLDTISTLGFRGEALAAAAAVAKLEIVTSIDGKEAWKIVIDSGTSEIEQTRRVKGTSIRAVGIFDALPARKRFLKKDAAEGVLCRQAFIDKALAFPRISFRFSQDNKLKDLPPAVSTYKERFAALVAEQEIFLHEIVTTGEGFTVHIVVGGQELSSVTRRQQYIFVNGRRIQEFSLQQALEYGTQGWFPNGTHPIGAVFVTIDPALVDFNVHPAKREVRWRSADTVHHAITECLQNFVQHFYAKTRNISQAAADTVHKKEAEAFLFSEKDENGNDSRAAKRKPELPLYEESNDTHAAAKRQPASQVLYIPQSDNHQDYTASLAMEALLKAPQAFAKLEPAPVSRQVRYIGQVFDLFLLAEKDEQLFIIDQHAAHERILYDKFLSQPITSQGLLVSIPLITESAEDDRFLERYRPDLERLGIGLVQEDGTWLIEALPVNWHKSNTETVREILELKTAHENMAKRWAATLACHTAIKDGDYLDKTTAAALAQKALSLPDPHCPHGRPVFFVISREQLFKAVHRRL